MHIGNVITAVEPGFIFTERDEPGTIYADICQSATTFGRTLDTVYECEGRAILYCTLRPGLFASASVCIIGVLRH